MLTGLAALNNADWSKLHHAYGRATDTPGHLRALLNADPKARDAAISHLWSAIIHQGTPWTATGPAALVIAGLLSEEAITREASLQTSLLRFLTSVAEAPEQTDLGLEELKRLAAFDITPFLDSDDEEALYENDDAANSFFARSILSCIDVSPVLMQVMQAGMNSTEPCIRVVAAMGAVALARNAATLDYAHELESQLLVLAQEAEDKNERCAHVLALGELGGSPDAFLADVSPAVRMCAALAPSLAADPIAIRELLHTLEHHAGEIDDWFTERPPQFRMRPRFAVIARLVSQVKDFDRLANAAIAVTDITAKYCVDFDWGPLLVAAFSDGSGTIQSESQRRFLRALVNKPELWDTTFGNAFRWFREAGLVYDHQACAKLVEAV